MKIIFLALGLLSSLVYAQAGNRANTKAYEGQCQSAHIDIIDDDGDKTAIPYNCDGLVFIAQPREKIMTVKFIQNGGNVSFSGTMVNREMISVTRFSVSGMSLRADQNGACHLNWKNGIFVSIVCGAKAMSPNSTIFPIIGFKAKQ